MLLFFKAFMIQLSRTWLRVIFVLITIFLYQQKNRNFLYLIKQIENTFCVSIKLSKHVQKFRRTAFYKGFSDRNVMVSYQEFKGL